MDCTKQYSVEYYMSLTSDVKNYCRSIGADLVGIADLSPLKSGLPVLPQDLLKPYTYAISLAIRLDDTIINSIIDGPTPKYADHYRNVNASLDRLTFQLEEWIVQKGFRAQAVPASRIIDEKQLLGNISHKAVARMAGIGWQGKSLLIISLEFGPRIRLATLLTDMPLDADEPLDNGCGECTECTAACPASAIKNVSTDSHYAHRDDAIYLERCADKTSTFKTMPGIGATICGVCIKVCPYGST